MRLTLALELTTEAWPTAPSPVWWPWTVLTQLENFSSIGSSWAAAYPADRRAATVRITALSRYLIDVLRDGPRRAPSRFARVVGSCGVWRRGVSVPTGILAGGRVSPGPSGAPGSERR